MDKWEYLRLSVIWWASSYDNNELHIVGIYSNGAPIEQLYKAPTPIFMNYLDDLGRQGWEMVSFVHERPFEEFMFFKRHIE